MEGNRANRGGGSEGCQAKSGKNFDLQPPLPRSLVVTDRCVGSVNQISVLVDVTKKKKKKVVSFQSPQ